MKIRAVYLWQNGMVMVFDTNGEQVGDLQGPLADVREKVVAATDDNTEFHRGQWGAGHTARMSRQEFAAAVA